MPLDLPIPAHMLHVAGLELLLGRAAAGAEDGDVLGGAGLGGAGADALGV